MARRTVHISTPTHTGEWRVATLDSDDSKELKDPLRFVHGPYTVCDNYEQALRLAAEMSCVYECRIIDHKEVEDREPPECEYTDRPVCPYRKTEQYDDEYHESDQMACNECGKDFEVERDVTVKYTTKKIAAGGR